MTPIPAQIPRLADAAATIGAATAVSRILGYVRDAVIAALFGAGLGADAFFVAFRIPNLLRRLFADGALTSAFVPAFITVDQQQGRESAFAFGRSSMAVVALIALGVAGIGFLMAPGLVRLLAPGYTVSSPLFDHTVLLTRAMLPYLVWIGVVAVAAGTLNGVGHFLAPALAPAVLNVSIIAAAFGLTVRVYPPVLSLGIGIVVGGALQMALQGWALWRMGFCFTGPIRFRNPVLIETGRRLLPAVFGGSVYQVNLLVTTVLATFLATGSVSYLYFADRLVQLPLGLFAMAAATAMLPILAQKKEMGDLAGFRHTVGRALTRVLFLTAPAMAGLILLRMPIVDVLFGHGEFDATAVRLTASAVLYYASGLWAVAASRIWTAAYHALQDFRTPVVCGAIGVTANLILGIALMPILGHLGLALAISLASMLQTACLAAAFRWQHGVVGGRWMFRRIIVIAGLTGAMSVAVWITAFHLFSSDTQNGFGSVWQLAVGIGGGLVTYLGLATACQCEEMDSISAMLRRALMACIGNRAKKKT